MLKGVVKNYLILALFVIPYCLMGQAVLTATVNKNTVAVGEQFQVTYTLNTSGKNFHGPDLKDFYVLSGPNQSSSMQIINGSISQSISFIYYLQGKAEGNFKIGFASIETDGKKIQSNGIIINVVKGSANASQGKQQQGTAATETGLSEKNIFVRAVVNKSSVYQGEALAVTFKLYTNVNIVNYGIQKMPSFAGFWNQDIEMPEQLQLYSETVDGINYKVGEIKKLVLFPQQNGTLTIDPMELECIARIQTKGGSRMDPFGIFNDPFFGFGGARDVKYAFRSNKVVVNVKALPPNAPAAFNGSVGQLNFDAVLDKNETKANEPVSLKIKINGNGNLKLIESPAIEFPADIESYDPKINDNLKVSESGVSGSKTIEYLLIPRQEGTYELEPVTFCYFDLNKKQYISKTEGPFTLKVGKGSGNTTVVTNAVSKSDFQLIGKDIRYIKTNEPDFISPGGFYGSLPYYALMISPFLLFGGLLVYRSRMEVINSDLVSLKSRKATAMAKKRLDTANKFLTAKQETPFYEEVSKALWGYMGDKLALPLADLSKEKVQNVLTSRNVKEEFISDFVATVDHCEMARFAGSLPGMDSSTIYTNAVNVITNIEQSIKS